MRFVIVILLEILGISTVGCAQRICAPNF